MVFGDVINELTAPSLVMHQKREAFASLLGEKTGPLGYPCTLAGTDPSVGGVGTTPEGDTGCVLHAASIRILDAKLNPRFLLSPLPVQKMTLAQVAVTTCLASWSWIDVNMRCVSRSPQSSG